MSATDAQKNANKPSSGGPGKQRFAKFTVEEAQLVVDLKENKGLKWVYRILYSVTNYLAKSQRRFLDAVPKLLESVTVGSDL